MVRRNLIPNGRPAGLTGWSGSEGNATRLSFDIVDGLISYSAQATGPGAQAGYGWFDPTAIHVRPGELYAFSVDNLDVMSLPTGFLRLVLLWNNELGATVSAQFGTPLDVATYTPGHPSTRIVAQAPDDAAFALPSILWLGDDTTAPVAWTASGLLLEPLGPPPVRAPGALVNYLTTPTSGMVVERPGPPTGDAWGDGTGWSLHVGGPVPGSIIWEPSEAWAKTPGGKSRRAAVTTGTALLPNGLMGYTGSYISPYGVAGQEVAPGQEWTWSAEVNVTAPGSTGDPGVFLEMFWFYYDGDPAHTVLIRQDNSDGLYSPEAIQPGEQRLTMTRTCPPGANLLQLTSVMATFQPSWDLEFYTDQGILTRTSGPVPYFDGDTLGAGWEGIPGYSVSSRPGRSARAPGRFFDGDDVGAQWEGARLQTMSTLRTRRRQMIQQGPTDPHTLDLLRRL